MPNVLMDSNLATVAKAPPSPSTKSSLVDLTRIAAELARVPEAGGATARQAAVAILKRALQEGRREAEQRLIENANSISLSF